MKTELSKKYPLGVIERERLHRMTCDKLNQLNALLDDSGYRPHTPTEGLKEVIEQVEGSSASLDGRPIPFTVFEGPKKIRSINCNYPGGGKLKFSKENHMLGKMEYNMFVDIPEGYYRIGKTYKWIINAFEINNKVLDAMPYIYELDSMVLNVSYPYKIDRANFSMGAVNGYYEDLFNDLNVVFNTLKKK